DLWCCVGFQYGEGETMLSQDLIVAPTQGRPPAPLIEASGRNARDRIEHFLRAAIDNSNTRQAYGRALGSFFAFLEDGGRARRAYTTSVPSTRATISKPPRPTAFRPPPSSSTWPPSACSSTTWSPEPCSSTTRRSQSKRRARSSIRARRRC